MKLRERTAELWNSFLYWWGRRSLQSRLIAAYVFIIFGPCLIVSVYAYQSINQAIIKDAVEKNKYLLSEEKTHILNQVENLARAAQMVDPDQNIQIKDFLANENEPLLGDLLDFKSNAYRELMRIVYTNPNIDHLQVFSNNPYMMELWPVFFNERRILSEPWFRQAQELEGQELWLFQNHYRDVTKRYITEDPDNRPRISLVRAMIIPVDRQIATLQVGMLLEQFAPRIFSELQDGTSQMILADQSMQLFTRGENSFLDANGRMEQAIADRIVRFRETGEWDTEYAEGGKSYLLLIEPVERIGASLVNVVSMQNTFKDIARTRNQIIGMFMGFIILVSVIAYILNAFILKNLRQLTEAMKQVRRGQTYSGIVIRGGGEVGELAHHFSKLMSTVNTLVAQAVRREALSKEAELRTLHNQIDAHFLYNTLENIKMLAEIENQRAISDALTSLGGMMRYNFKWSGEYVKLQDEIRHIQNYVEVMNIRFDEPVVLELDIPEPFMKLEVLKMSLQPVVENSVKHAWDDAGGTAERRVSIAVTQEAGNMIYIAIKDNGNGLSEERLLELNRRIYARDNEEAEAQQESRRGKPSGGIGLKNVHQRLQIFYGEEYGLEVHSKQNEGTTVYMTLPKVLLTGEEQP